MAVSSLLPTTRPLSLSPPPSSIPTRTDDTRRVSFSPITYPKLSHSNSTPLLSVKSTKHCNVHIIVEEDEPEENLISRFRIEVIKAGVFQECRRRRFFETPIDKIKRKRREAGKRNRKRRQYNRIPVPDKSDSANKENNDDDDDEDDDNWEVLT